MTLEELNASVADGSVSEVIRVAETRQRKALSRIADTVCARGGVRVVLLAGASSAGKTTSAKRLCTQLRVNERAALHLSTDDYFVGDARNPRDENGELDYEHVDCVDRVRLAADLNALIRGETIRARRFDFQRHEGYDSDRALALPADGIVVLEGIHALNPLVAEGLDPQQCFRVYIDPVPSIDIFGGLRQTSADARFLRRMVRDCHFRRISPVETVHLWPKVLAGEEKWIRPFSAGADATFDSYLVYELALLKFYVGGLLERARRELGDIRLLMSEIRLLEHVSPINDEFVPGDSILRETIGNSQLEF